VGFPPWLFVLLFSFSFLVTVLLDLIILPVAINAPPWQYPPKVPYHTLPPIPVAVPVAMVLPPLAALMLAPLATPLLTPLALPPPTIAVVLVIRILVVVLGLRACLYRRNDSDREHSEK